MEMNHKSHLVLAIFPCLVRCGVIGDLEWLSGGLRVPLFTSYPAAPSTRTMVVAGFGNCAVQMPEAWQRHLFEPDEPAPTGNCDTWDSNHNLKGVGEALYFGDQSLQPHYSDYIGLAATNSLYGFTDLPNHAHNGAGSQNRIFQAPAPAHLNGATWTFQGDKSLTFTTSTADLPLQIVLDSDYGRLAKCTNFGGNPVLSITQSNSKTAYSFSLYLLTLELDPDYPSNSGKLKSTCTHRQFTHSIGSTISASWGGFGTTDGVVAYTALGVQANYLLNLLADPAEAAVAFQDPDIISTLETQIVLVFQSLQADDWVLDLTMDDPYLALTRRSDPLLASYLVPFTAIYRMLNAGSATSDVATMGAVLRHVVAQVFSNTPDFKTQFVQQWRERYVNQTGKAWPLPSVRLADPPFTLTLPGPNYVTTLTAPPSPVSPSPTPQPTPDTTESTQDNLGLILGLAGGGLLVGIGITVSVFVWYSRTKRNGVKYQEVQKP